jgi:hypothetical protein
MKKKLKEKILAEMRVLNRHLERESGNAQIYRKFITWYVNSRFGTHGVKQIFLDGAGDNGFDAIVLKSDEIFFLQSKYEVKPRLSSVPSKELKKFSKDIALLKSPETKPERRVWLKKFKSDSRNAISEALTRYHKNKVPIRFIFLTTKISNDDPTDFEIEDARIIEYRWGLRNFPPPVERLDIVIRQSMHIASNDGEFTTYVGIADAQQFVRKMKDDSQDHLFDQNIRTEVTGSKVNKGIIQTYETERERFLLGNNGVYIVCSHVKRKGNKFQLLFPSVINGYQTLKSVAKSDKHHACDILVRVLAVGSVDKQRKLLNAVIRRTNKSNPIKDFALHAHDEYQVNITRHLDQYRVFYERRPKEWQNLKKMIMPNYLPVEFLDMAQWWATYGNYVKLGTARSSPGSMLEPDEKYEAIFKQFSTDANPEDFAALPVLAWSGLFFNDVHDYFGIESEKRVMKMSKLVFVKAYSKVIMSSEELRKKTLKALEQGRVGYKDLPNDLKKFIRNEVRMILGMYKKHEAEMDLNVFFKNNEQTQATFEKLMASKSRGRIHKTLMATIDNIK